MQSTNTVFGRLDASKSYLKLIFGTESCHCLYTAYSINLSEFKASTLSDKTESLGSCEPRYLAAVL